MKSLLFTEPSQLIPTSTAKLFFYYFLFLISPRSHLQSLVLSRPPCLFLKIELENTVSAVVVIISNFIHLSVSGGQC